MKAIYNLVFILLAFVFTYFDFWRSYLAFLLPLTAQKLIRLVHEEKNVSAANLILTNTRNAIILLLTVVFVDYATKSVGMLVVKNYVLRKSNQELLHNIPCGVMILDEGGNELKFANRMAKNIT